MHLLKRYKTSPSTVQLKGAEPAQQLFPKYLKSLSATCYISLYMYNVQNIQFNYQWQKYICLCNMQNTDIIRGRNTSTSLSVANCECKSLIRAELIMKFLRWYQLRVYCKWVILRESDIRTMPSMAVNFCQTDLFTKSKSKPTLKPILAFIQEHRRNN